MGAAENLTYWRVEQTSDSLLGNILINDLRLFLAKPIICS
jgi:hypothetical protein